MSADELAAVDLLLGDGTPEQREAARARIAGDLDAALEMADTVQLFESLRTLRTEPSARLDSMLRQVCNEAGRRQRLRHGAPVRLSPMLWAAVLAAAVLAALLVIDPLQRRGGAGAGVDHVPVVRAQAVPEPWLPLPVAEKPDLLAQLSARFHEADNPARLLANLQRIVEAAPPAGMSDWLRSANTLALLRLDYELRRSPEYRRQALARLGGTEDTALRIEQLQAELVSRAEQQALSAVERALVLRALLGAGATLDDEGGLLGVLQTGLRAELDGGAPGLGDRIAVLTALADFAARTGFGGEDLASRVDQLLGEELGDAPGRPGLLSWRTPVGVLADAGRLFQMAAGFGADPQDCLRVRQGMLAHLEERRDTISRDDPRLLAAEAYGFADLLGDDEVERKLRAWRLVQLLPDYQVVYHVAASRSPSRRGFSRFQIEARRLNSEPTPASTGDCAALLLCLTGGGLHAGGIALAGI